MNLGKGLGHLTYSTLVHQTDNWEQLWKSVNTYLPAVKARVAPHEKFGVCLRTSAPSAELLSAEPSKVADLKKFFADNDLYLYTANAFVYGVFKKQIIKEDVYEPDWATPERREYTKKVANLLAELAPEGINPSIQSAPLGFKPKVTGDDVVEAYTSNVIDVVAHLAELKKKNVKWKDPVQRYKGLGEMDADQLAETTMDPRRRTLRRLTVDDANLSAEVFELLMGSDVAPRKEFIVQGAYEVDMEALDA